MELKYEMTKDDHLAFNLHYVKHSKTIKQSLFMQRFLVPIIFLILPFVLFWMIGEFLIGFFITFALISIVWIVFYPKYFYGHIIRNVKKVLNEGSNDNLLGQHVFISTEDGFIEKSRVGETKIGWSSIERIEENEDYFFLFISTMNAYIVPKRSFPDKASQEDFKKMIDKAN
ncbi:YcxB family protein [Peribacillus loiseleuriae]|uniref:YcxB family protein n=1 Tax=Peribacillus loiseleuriae TaxID=1679170 RepID=UPI003D05B62D